MEPSWVNYHKHTSLSNRYMKDSPILPIDYWNELKKRYGDKPCIYTTVEHGWAGNYFKQYDDLEKYNKKNGTNIQWVYGCEAYWVKNRHEQDRSNCHIVLLALTDKGRKAINKAVSIANKDGYYYGRPRVDMELLLGLPPDDVMVTTACVAFWNKYEDIDTIVMLLSQHFPHFYLEVQPHDTDKQRDINRHIIELNNTYGISIIAGCDSHYITANQAQDRDELLKSSDIHYEDEDGWYMDYPTYDELVARFKRQGVLSDGQIADAIEATNLLFAYETIKLDRSLKVPVIKPLRDKTQAERNVIFEQILKDEWKAQRGDIDADKLAQYQREIQHDIGEIEACNMADYFILSYEVMKRAQEVYDGILTPSGRGSAVSMFLNKLLRLTKVDKVNSPVLMYSERFLTKERVLDSHTPPDIDNNVSTREPFIQAQRDLVGDLGTYDLLAMGTLKFKAAWKMYARAFQVPPETANEISQQIGRYEKAVQHADGAEVDIKQYIDAKYQDMVDGCRVYMGIYDNAKGHPCFTENELVMTANGYKKIKDITTEDSVLSHDGKYHKVKKVFITPNVSNVYEITTYGSPAIQATGNHPFYAKKRNENPAWKTVEQLEQGDLIGVPVNCLNKLPNLNFVSSANIDFWWCIGRYFGDGWRSHTVRKSGRKTGQKIKDVIICCNKNNNETNEILSHASWCSVRVVEEATTNKIYFKNKDLYNWLEEFGDYAIGKRLTGTILNLPIKQLQSFLSGYFSADGHFDKRTNEQIFSTINKELALGIVACINKAYHRPCSLIQSRKDRIETIQGRQVNSHAQYRGDFHYESRKQDRALYQDGMIWVPYRRKIKIEKPQTVYNFEVEDTHNYTVNNLLVHNCGCLCLNGDAEEEIGISLCKSEATGKEVLVANIESGTIDAFGYLKQDYLVVDSVGLTYDVYKEAGIEPFTVNELLAKIEHDDATWQIYADGYTQCVNQCEQPKSTQKVMRYKPKNISELTQFIAAIRPGFQSMYNTFESRQHFDYGIKALDDLLQDQYCTSSFMLYQESLMKVLGFAGFPMSETYTIVKAISKKKDYVIKEAKPKFIANFAKAIIDTGDTNDEQQAHELADKVWRIIEDNASYSFNSAHAYCMAVDSVTIAYLKAHYPLEFYKCVLQRYTDKGEKDKVSLIKQEMLKRGFKLKDIKFGDDNRQFNIDRANNCIVQTMASIKDMPKSTPQALYELGQKGVRNRGELYQAIMDDSRINKTATEILFKLGYFEQFGHPNKLIAEYEVYQKYIAVKVLTKANLDDKIIEDVRQCCGKETEKQFRDIDNKALIVAVLKNTPIKPTTITDRIQWQLQYLGYCTVCDKSRDVNDWAVIDVRTNNYGAVILKLYNLAYGAERTYRLNKQWAAKHQCKAGDVIKAVLEDKPKWRKVDDKFVKTGETETQIKCYKVLEDKT